MIDTFVTQMVLRISNSSRANSEEKEATQKRGVDEGILLYLIHYLIKKFPLLVPVICKTKVYKTVYKVIQNEEECNNLLLLPYQLTKTDSQSIAQNNSHSDSLNFVHFLTRVVMRHCQHYSRDLLLELCMDSFVMHSSNETYANEIRR